MRSMWNHWMWGFLMGAFFMSYMGKWVRRSEVMTGAEWMLTRFGNRVDGKTARVSYTIMAVVMLTGFIGYAFQIEMKYKAHLLGFSITEIPVVFTDRTHGESKLSKGIISEAIFGVMAMKLKRIIKQLDL